MNSFVSCHISKYVNFVIKHAFLNSPLTLTCAKIFPLLHSIRLDSTAQILIDWLLYNHMSNSSKIADITVTAEPTKIKTPQTVAQK